MTAPDTRAITLVDIPLVRRLSESGMVLNSEMGLTRDARGPNSALLSSILFPRGLYTLVARSDSQRVVGQFRYRPDDTCAHIVYLAPKLDDESEDTVWLHILDAMAREAGKHGAHSLVAEVETSSFLFETMRTARFATYARQTIWRHDPVTSTQMRVDLAQETTQDHLDIMSLMGKIVPTLLQPVTAPHSDMNGYVYRKEGKLQAYIAVTAGNHGVYMIPYIHPDVLEDTADIIKAAMADCQQAHKVPVYVCVRSYQTWLNDIMERMDFEEWIEQAIMVKHIAAGIRHPSFERPRMSGKLEAAHTVPPTWSLTLQQDEDEEQS